MPSIISSIYSTTNQNGTVLASLRAAKRIMRAAGRSFSQMTEEERRKILQQDNAKQALYIGVLIGLLRRQLQASTDLQTIQVTKIQAQQAGLSANDFYEMSARNETMSFNEVVEKLLLKIDNTYAKINQLFAEIKGEQNKVDQLLDHREEYLEKSTAAYKKLVAVDIEQIKSERVHLENLTDEDLNYIMGLEDSFEYAEAQPTEEATHRRDQQEKDMIVSVKQMIPFNAKNMSEQHYNDRVERAVHIFVERASNPTNENLRVMFRPTPATAHRKNQERELQRTDEELHVAAESLNQVMQQNLLQVDLFMGEINQNLVEIIGLHAVINNPNERSIVNQSSAIMNDMTQQVEESKREAFSDAIFIAKRLPRPSPTYTRVVADQETETEKKQTERESERTGMGMGKNMNMKFTPPGR